MQVTTNWKMVFRKIVFKTKKIETIKIKRLQ